MPWLKLDDSMGEHRKTRRVLRTAGLAPFGLHALGLLHAARYLTDGFVEQEYVEEVCDLARVRERDRPELVAALESPQLWVPTDGGWVLHDYLDYNPSKAQVLEARRKDSERKAAGRRSESRRSPNGIHADAERIPTPVHLESARPVPTRPVPGEEREVA